MRRLSLVVLPSLLLMACADGGGASEKGSTATTEADGGGGDDGGTSGDDGGTEDGGGSGDGGGTGDDGGTGDGGGGGDDGGDDGGSSTWTVEPVLSSAVVREADEGGVLTVDCVFSLDGTVVETDAPTTVVISPSDGVVEGDDGWTFADYGSHSVQCSGEVDGVVVEGSRDVIVMTEVLAPAVADALGAIASVRSAQLQITAANDGEDAAMVSAIEALGLAAAEAQDLADNPPDAVFRSMPEEWWPTAEALEAAGIAPHADDGQFAVALTDWATALEALDAYLLGLDPATMDEAQLEQVVALDAAVTDAGAVLTGLSPSTHALLAYDANIASQLLEPALRVNARWAALVEARMRLEAESILPPFGLAGMAIGMVNVGGIRGMYIEHVIVPVVEQLDLSINNLILMGLIEYYAPGSGGVSITHIQASSSAGIALPGYDTWIYGSGLSTTPSLNKFIIVGVEWQEAVGSILDGCGIEEGDTVPDIVEDVEGCMDTVNDAIENSQATPNAWVDHDVWGPGVGIGAFPEVCGDGWIPVTIGLMAINMESGERTTGFEALTCLP